MDEISKPYAVALIDADTLSTTDRIATEVRFVTALEDACAQHGGVLETFDISEARLDAWAEEEVTGPDDKGPETIWMVAIRAAEAAAWAGHTRPEGATFDVRVNAPLRYGSMFTYPDDVPF